MIVPPYCGFPSLSHQLPVEVVTGLVVVELVGGTAVDEVVVLGAVEVVVCAEVVDEVDVEVFVQEASNSAATIRMLKLNQISLFLIFILLFNGA